MASRKKSSTAPSSDEPREGARAIWKGSISFGLVNIPVSLKAATRREELKFRLLRAKDLSPVNYKRVAQVDGREVPWDEIVKGYEYQKNKFVVLKDDDFKRVDIEATQTIDIMDFVPLDEINPIYFMRPYYLEPLRGGGSAYALLRDVLSQTGKTGIAKVVIKTRQHLAAIKANGQALVLELMHFADELVSSSTIHMGKAKTPSKREIDMARTLVSQMTEKWDPKRYNDDYASALMKLIDRKIESGGKELPEKVTAPKAASNVVDLVALLQKSLDDSGSGQKATGKKRRKAA
ncbi:Ku protein [Oleiharenicola lentus]|uniref:non-homologous end joining protein Ku n=1 Tax=Oleiharenicola lentus TaxID=2508720 RepID=UPI003F662551